MTVVSLMIVALAVKMSLSTCAVQNDNTTYLRVVFDDLLGHDYDIVWDQEHNRGFTSHTDGNNLTKNVVHRHKGMWFDANHGCMK